MTKVQVPACVILAALSVSFATAAAERESASTELSAAERAYQEVDFATARDHAAHGLAIGGATREETGRLYVLLGISDAATGNDADAKRALIVALGVNPSLKLDRSLSPKIRGPYLEAQGFWGAYPEHLEVRAHVSGDGERLSVHLTDPAHLAFKIELRARALGDGVYQSFEAFAKDGVNFSLPERARARGFEYFIRLLDKDQNTLADAGSEDDPRIERTGALHGAADAGRRRTDSTSSRSYLWPTVLAVGGAGAVAAGIVFHIARESEARTWNGPSCEQPNSSRIEQCSAVDSRRRRDDALAVGGYALGGALLAGSAVWLIAGRPAKEPSRDALLGCTLAGPGVRCAGHF
ncbi:MAG TPA: hypothetical protein VF395_18410 [Polyangiaceae bacterium]